MSRRSIRRSAIIGLPLVLPIAMLATPAIAQVAPLPDTAATDAADTTDGEIVVTGSYARSLAESQRLKREAAYSLDAISATDIGRFPNQNVAEALQVVPGVAITRPRGEGQYISVRGLGPQFQNTVLNGRQIAVNEFIENGNALGSQFRFEMLPSEFASRIAVVKTPTADMTEGALGGNINVSTLRPSDVGNATSLMLRATYTTLPGKVTPTLTAIHGWQSADGTFGLLAGAQYLQRKVRNDHLWNFGWNQNVALFRGELGSGIFTPTRTRPTIEVEDRQRLSGIVSAEWKPTPELSTTIDVLATRLDVEYDEAGMDIYPDDRSRIVSGSNASVNLNAAVPSFRAGTARIIGDTAVAGTIDNARYMAAREHALNRHDLLSIGVRQAWTPGRWSVAADANWSRAHSYFPTLADATIRSRAAFYAPFTYDGSAGYTNMPAIAETRNWSDPANYQIFPFQVAYKNSADEDFNTTLEAGRTFDGFVTRIVAGGQYHFRMRDYLRQDITVGTLNGQPLTLLGNGAYGTPYRDFLSAVGGNAPRNWIVPDTGAFMAALFTPDLASRPMSVNDMAASFRVSLRTYAGYARADFGTGALTGNVGLRYVHTDQVASGTINIGTSAAPRAQAVSYPMTFDNILPSANLRYDLTPTLVARAGLSRVLSRPNVIDNAPRITLANDSPTGTGGNPALKPFLATQADAGLEWYFGRRAALTGAVFYKNMDDYITAQSRTITVPGRNDAAGAPIPITLSTQVNGGNAKLYGAEFSYNQVFDFLPQPFDGMGVQATYTRVEIESRFVAGGRTVTNQLPGLSKNSANFVLFYDRDALSARVLYVWRDKYLNAANTSVLAPVYTAAFGSLDGSVSYALTRSVQVTLEGLNLANASTYNYADNRYRFAEIANYGRTVMMSVRAKF